MRKKLGEKRKEIDKSLREKILRLYSQFEENEFCKIFDNDFFGYNKNLELQYRGRLRELKNLVPVRSGESDLLKAMKQIVKTGKGPESQIPSAGCGIKWKQ